MCDYCSYGKKVYWLYKRTIFTFETTYIYKDLMDMRDVCVCTELCTRCSCSYRTVKVLILRVQNYDCVVCAETGAVCI